MAFPLGLIFVGVVLVGGAIQQVRTGETFGLSGRGHLTRNEAPGYFGFLLVSRVLLGGACVVAGCLALP